MSNIAHVRIEKIDGDLPRKEGVYVANYPHNDAAVSFNKLNISDCTTLTDLAKEYTFFTHAALFVYGNWLDDPIKDYITVDDPKCAPFWLTFDEPIFSGLFFRDAAKHTNREWEHKLMGCPNETWPGLLSFLQSLSGVNRQEKRFHVTVAQKLSMLDYLALRRGLATKLIDVYTIGLLGNNRSVLFKPPTDLRDKIRVKLSAPDPKIVELSKNILSSSPGEYRSNLWKEAGTGLSTQ